jgi:hypothetical protein
VKISLDIRFSLCFNTLDGNDKGVKQMNHREFIALVKEAETISVGESISELAGNAAEIIGAYDRPTVSKIEAIALIKWQCRTFGGSWDSVALTETQLWFRKVSVA